MPDPLLLHLIPPDNSLFFSKNDPDDLRMGDLTARDISDVPSTTRAVLIGVPQDIGVERNGGRTGAALAPDVIRSMMYKMTPYDFETNSSIPKNFLFDAGNIRCDGTLEEIHERLTLVTEYVCRAGMIPITLGGGHDITYATVSAVFNVFGKAGVLNLDAHLDVRKPAPHRNSGTSFRMLLEEEKIQPNNFIEFGVQSFVNAASHVQWLKEQGGRIIRLDEIRSRGFSKTLAAAYLMASTGVEAVHGSLDIDGVRAANAPGVSATVPNGFSAAEFLNTARLLGRRAKTVSLDIVEVNPNFDHDNVTAKLAAHGVMQFLAGLAERNSP